MLPPLGGEMQCEAAWPQFRSRFVPLSLARERCGADGPGRHVDLAQPDEEDARRVEQALAQLGIAATAEDDFGALGGSSSWC